MKHLALFILLSTCCLGATAQGNLVPNGGFDYAIPSCPNSLDDLDTNAYPWRSYAKTTPDMYHSCGNMMPNSPFGYQMPHSGQGYAGIIQYNIQNPDWREYITTPITSMQVGAYYEVSISVSVAELSEFFSDGLGIHFTDGGPSPQVDAPVILTPKIDYKRHGMLTDTANWIRLTDTLYADSSYDRIIIGNFFDTSNQTRDSTYFGSTCGCIYTYIDSVVVKIISDVSITFTDTMLCDPDTINVPYSIFALMNTNNVCTLQLSNASGSFANPINIGTRASNVSGTISGVIPPTLTPGNGYRLRVITSSPADTSLDNGKNISIGFTAPIKPVATNNSPVCSNDTLRFTATTSTTGVSYSWTGPDTFSSVLQNPTILNPMAKHQGDYIVTARLYGCVAKDTTTAIVVGTPVPTNVQATNNGPICADDTLKLSGSANGSSLSYTWTGPGNFTSTVQNPIIPSAGTGAGGVYWLTVNQGLCSATDSVDVTVKPRPAAFSASANSPLCSGTALNLTGSSTSSGVTYNWSGPIGFTATGSTPYINGATVANSGTYYVTATLNGCPLYDTVTVLVKPTPAKPIAASNTPICAGDTLSLTATSSTSGVSYSWTGPGSYTSSSQNPAVANSTTSMTGDYIVTVNQNGCTRSDTEAVVVKPTPVQVSAASNGPVCAGDTLHINIPASSTGVSYNWSGPNNFTANTQHTYVANSTTVATGWYKAVLDLNGCLFSDSVYAVVKMMPSPPSASYSQPLCVTENLQLTAMNVPNAAFNWTGPNNFNASVQNPVRNNVSFADTGMYYVTATVNGCTSSAGSVRISANPVPFVSVMLNPGDTICAGDIAHFTAFPNNHGGSPQFRWYVNNTSVGTNAVYTTTLLNDGDIIHCEMTEYTKCNTPYTDESDYVTMTVLPWLAPAVIITASPNRPLLENEYVTFTSLVNDAGLLPRYQWKRNGQDVQGATGPVWSANTLNDNDSISVEIISSYRCPQPPTTSSNGIRVKILTGVDDVSRQHHLALYPNPNNGNFILSGKVNTDKPVQLDVINAIGQVVHSETITANTVELNKEIQLSNVANGIYLLKIYVNGETKGIRFRVER